MKVIKSSLAVLVTGLALALFAGMAMAQDQTTPPAGGHYRGMRGGFMGGPEMGFLFHKLNPALTDEQKSDIKKIIESQKTTMQPLMKQERAAQEQMMQLITSGNFEQAQASAILAREAQTHLALGMAHAKMASQIFQEVLTPDQRNQVTAMIAQRKLRMQQRTQEKDESAPQPNE